MVELQDSPKVSVVIPCFNHGVYLAEAIQSLLEQGVSDWEAIIVDDGSTDSTDEIVGQLTKLDKRVFSLRTDNRGLSAARNAGIGIARGKYILPLDADDCLAPSFLSDVLNSVGEHDYRVVATGVEKFGFEAGIYTPPSTIAEHSFVGKNPIVCTSLFSKRLWKEIGGYDEIMRDGYEDWEFWIRASMVGVEFIVIPKPLFRYRRHRVSMLGGSDGKRQEIIGYIVSKHPEYFRRHYDHAINSREGEIARLKSDYQRIVARLEFISSCKEMRIGSVCLFPLRILKLVFVRFFRSSRFVEKAVKG